MTTTEQGSPRVRTTRRETQSCSSKPPAFPGSGSRPATFPMTSPALASLTLLLAKKSPAVSAKIPHRACAASSTVGSRSSASSAPFVTVSPRERFQRMIPHLGDRTCCTPDSCVAILRERAAGRTRRRGRRLVGGCSRVRAPVASGAAETERRSCKARRSAAHPSRMLGGGSAPIPPDLSITPRPCTGVAWISETFQPRHGSSRGGQKSTKHLQEANEPLCVLLCHLVLQGVDSFPRHHHRRSQRCAHVV